MLVVDPMKRIKINEIREHAWFRTRLPHYLAVPPPDTAIQARKVQFLLPCLTFFNFVLHSFPLFQAFFFFILLQIDEEVLEQVIKMGYDKIKLLESLSSRSQNEVIFSNEADFKMKQF